MRIPGLSVVGKPPTHASLKWSHTFNAELVGLDNRIVVSVPLYSMGKHDSLIIQSVHYRPSYREIQIVADILRYPPPEQQAQPYDEDKSQELLELR
jgi:hypothetical protein